MSTASLLWLLPIVFMLHDFEELIMLRPWMQKHARDLQGRLPGVAARVLPHVANLSTGGFAVAVLEEFVLLSALTWLAVENRLYALWVALTLGFALHLVVHVLQGVALRRYVPALATSVPAGAYCAYALLTLSGRERIAWDQAGLWALVAVVAIVANLAFAHWLARGFDAWSSRYLEK